VSWKDIELININPYFEMENSDLEKDHADTIAFCAEVGYNGEKVVEGILH
jgi:hypothetical protein